MSKLAASLGKLHTFFEWLSYRAGIFFFLSALAAFAYGAAYYVLFDQDSDAAVRGAPVPFNILIFAGLFMILYSFVSGARNRTGKWPTMPIVAFAYLFAITIFTVVVARLDWLSFLPDIPDIILYANRTMLYWMIFSVGWVLGYGNSRGWNRRTVDPKPFRWLFRRAPALSEGTDESKPKKS